MDAAVGSVDLRAMDNDPRLRLGRRRRRCAGAVTAYFTKMSSFNQSQRDPLRIVGAATPPPPQTSMPRPSSVREEKSCGKKRVAAD